jgi:hypothetical protein
MVASVSGFEPFNSGNGSIMNLQRKLIAHSRMRLAFPNNQLRRQRRKTMNMSKRIFKPAVRLFVMSAMLFLGSLWASVPVATGARPKSKAPAPPQAQLKIPKIPISLEIGRKRKGKCEFAFGICKITIGIVSVTANKAGSVNAELTTTEDGKLQLTLLAKAPVEGKTLFVDEDIPLSQEIAEKLGVRNATIRRGAYAFSARKSVLNARLTK